jgi:hypothetical protein
VRFVIFHITHTQPLRYRRSVDSQQGRDLTLSLAFPPSVREVGGGEFSPAEVLFDALELPAGGLHFVEAKIG